MELNPLTLNLFAGPGGWCTGARIAGYDGPMVGIEKDAAACATARAAGHCRIRADVATYPHAPLAGRVDGLLASPPCPDWSITGKRLGYAGRSGWLIHEPLRWTLALRPRWTAWECTPERPVRDRFDADAAVLRRVGYDAAVWVLNAADYGVPSTRRRVFLVARQDAPVTAPRPVAPRTMADALGWGGAVLVSNNGTGGDPKRRGRRPMTTQAFTMTGRCGRNRWVWPDGTTRNLTVAEAGVLQSFPDDYPWQGGSQQRQQQVGDAVPPWLAAAVIGTLPATSVMERVA
jgi:DNA (cytosine-5)-methyltransferase 1